MKVARLRLVACLLLVAAFGAGCASPALTLTPTPTPVPVVELPLRTVPSAGCDGALLPDVALEVDGRRPEAIVAVAPDGTRIPLVFRAGTRAWVETGTGALEIQSPEGERIVVLSGQRASFGGGQMGEGDPAFFACSFVR